MKLKSLLAREIGTEVVLSFFLDFTHLRHFCLPFRKGGGGGVYPLLLVLLILFCLVYLGECLAYLQSVVLILSLVWQFFLLGYLLHPTILCSLLLWRWYCSHTYVKLYLAMLSECYKILNILLLVTVFQYASSWVQGKLILIISWLVHSCFLHITGLCFSSK